MRHAITVWDVGSNPPADATGSLVKYPFDWVVRDATTQSLGGWYEGRASYSFDYVDSGATTQSATLGAANYPFNAIVAGATTQSVMGSTVYSFDAQDNGATTIPDVDNPGVDPNAPKLPPRRIKFGYDASGLQVSMGASLIAAGTGDADGSMLRFAPMWDAPPVDSFTANLQEIFVSPRSFYGPFVRLEVLPGYTFFPHYWQYDSVPYCLVAVNVLPESTVGDISHFSIAINGQTLCDLGSDIGLESWVNEIEASALFSANHWTAQVGCGEYHLQNNGAYGTGQLSNASPFVRGWADSLGWHSVQSHIHFFLYVFPQIHGGSWVATWQGYTSEPIGYGDSAEMIEAKLNAMPSVAQDGGVRVRLERQDADARSRSMLTYRLISSGQAIPSPNLFPVPPITNESRIYISQKV